MADAAATEVWFYHLERTGLEQALPELLEKTLQRGWKALIRIREVERLRHLDGWLWTYRDESFLPHAPDDDAEAARQMGLKHVVVTSVARDELPDEGAGRKTN